MILVAYAASRVINSRNSDAKAKARAQSKTEIPSRALVCIAPPSAANGNTLTLQRYGDAALIVQLFACRDRLPQCRDKRRAEPMEAAQFYRSASSLLTKQHTSTTCTV